MIFRAATLREQQLHLRESRYSLGRHGADRDALVVTPAYKAQRNDIDTRHHAHAVASPALSATRGTIALFATRISRHRLLANTGFVFDRV